MNNNLNKTSFGNAGQLGQRLIARIRGINRLFLFTVALPTLLSAVYFGLIASDVYISESEFIIRSPNQQTSSPLGSLLQGTGLTAPSKDESSTVQSFILSRDALRELDGQMGIRKAFAHKDVDIFSRFAGLYWDKSFEALYKYYQRNAVDVQIDSTSSIVTLATSAFTAEVSYRMNQRLLEMSEALVNQLSDRARQDMIGFAAQEVIKAEKKDKEATLALARIQTGSRRVAEKGRSLASKVTEYQRIVLEKDFADKMLATAMSSLELARNEALHKQLYLERIVQPSNPDAPVEPKRLKNVIVTFIITMVIWGILSLLVAGIREHYE